MINLNGGNFIVIEFDDSQALECALANGKTIEPSSSIDGYFFEPHGNKLDISLRSNLPDMTITLDRTCDIRRIAVQKMTAQGTIIGVAGEQRNINAVSEIVILKDSVDVLQNKVTQKSAKADIKTKTDESKAYDGELDELNRKIDYINKQNSEKITEISVRRQELIRVSNELESLKKEVAEQEDKIAGIKNMLGLTEEKKREYDDYIAEHEAICDAIERSKQGGNDYYDIKEFDEIMKETAKSIEKLRAAFVKIEKAKQKADSDIEQVINGSGVTNMKDNAKNELEKELKNI